MAGERDFHVQRKPDWGRLLMELEIDDVVSFIVDLRDRGIGFWELQFQLELAGFQLEQTS